MPLTYSAVIPKGKEPMRTSTSSTVSADTDDGGGLQYQRCTWCSSAQPRHSVICRVCRNDCFQWERSAGVGRVVTPPAMGRYSATAHRFTVIQLNEGPLIDGMVVGGPQDQLWPGAPVRIRVAEDPSGRPVFELAERI